MNWSISSNETTGKQTVRRSPSLPTEEDSTEDVIPKIKRKRLFKKPNLEGRKFLRNIKTLSPKQAKIIQENIANEVSKKNIKRVASTPFRVNPENCPKDFSTSVENTLTLSPILNCDNDVANEYVDIEPCLTGTPKLLRNSSRLKDKVIPTVETGGRARDVAREKSFGKVSINLSKKISTINADSPSLAKDDANRNDNVPAENELSTSSVVLCEGAGENAKTKETIGNEGTEAIASEPQCVAKADLVAPSKTCAQIPSVSQSTADTATTATKEVLAGDILENHEEEEEGESKNENDSNITRNKNKSALQTNAHTLENVGKVAAVESLNKNEKHSETNETEFSFAEPAKKNRSVRKESKLQASAQTELNKRANGISEANEAAEPIAECQIENRNATHKKIQQASKNQKNKPKVEQHSIAIGTSPNEHLSDETTAAVQKPSVTCRNYSRDTQSVFKRTFVLPRRITNAARKSTYCDVALSPIHVLPAKNSKATLRKTLYNNRMKQLRNSSFETTPAKMPSIRRSRSFSNLSTAEYDFVATAKKTPVLNLNNSDNSKHMLTPPILGEHSVDTHFPLNDSSVGIGRTNQIYEDDDKMLPLRINESDGEEEPARKKVNGIRILQNITVFTPEPEGNVNNLKQTSDSSDIKMLPITEMKEVPLSENSTSDSSPTQKRKNNSKIERSAKRSRLLEMVEETEIVLNMQELNKSKTVFNKGINAALLNSISVDATLPEANMQYLKSQYCESLNKIEECLNLESCDEKESENCLPIAEKKSAKTKNTVTKSKEKNAPLERTNKNVVNNNTVLTDDSKYATLNSCVESTAANTSEVRHDSKKSKNVRKPKKIVTSPKEDKRKTKNKSKSKAVEDNCEKKNENVEQYEHEVKKKRPVKRSRVDTNYVSNHNRFAYYEKVTLQPMITSEVAEDVDGLRRSARERKPAKQMCLWYLDAAETQTENKTQKRNHANKKKRVVSPSPVRTPENSSVQSCDSGNKEENDDAVSPVNIKKRGRKKKIPPSPLKSKKNADVEIHMADNENEINDDALSSVNIEKKSILQTTTNADKKMKVSLKKTESIAKGSAKSTATKRKSKQRKPNSVMDYNATSDYGSDSRSNVAQAKSNSIQQSLIDDCISEYESVRYLLQNSTLFEDEADKNGVVKISLPQYEERIVICSAASETFKPVKENVNILLNRALEENVSGVSCGTLILKPKTTKPAQKSSKCSLLFTVLSGTAKLKIKDKVVYGKAKRVFFVPCDVYYTVINESKNEDLHLHFATISKCSE